MSPKKIAVVFVAFVAALLCFYACKFPSGGDTDPVPVTGVTLNHSSLEINVGESPVQLVPVITPANATNKNVTWSTSDAGKANVGTDGRLTPVASGTAVITVTTVDGGFTAQCTVTVKDSDSSPAPAGMALIPAGAFIMGSPVSEPEYDSTDEKQHSVTLTKSFYMGKYQVTQAQWVAVMGAGENRTETTYGQGDNYPVYKVSWYDVLVFCNKLSMAEGLDPVYSIDGKTNPSEWGPIPTSFSAKWNAATMDRSKNGYRLPTEAEWEYACRGDYLNKATETNTKPFGIGDGRKMISGMANFDVTEPYDLDHAPPGPYSDPGATGYVGKTTPVGSYAANNYGLFDMHGNVYEWCWDWYKENIMMDNTDPVGGNTDSIDKRVIRGGDWSCIGRRLRSAFRSYCSPHERHEILGFRLVRS